LFKFDTHVHTVETSPCARVKGAEIAKLYKEKGYSGIIVTDHYSIRTFIKMSGKSWDEKIEQYLSGYREAKRMGDAIGLKVLLGAELTFNFSINDYLVFGIDEEFLRKHLNLCKLGIAKLRKLADQYNLLVYQAHPYRLGMKRANPEFLDGVEVFNGNPRHNSKNDLALKFARKHGLLMSSGSDFHRMEDAATGGVFLPSVPENSQELVKMLRKQKSIELIRNSTAN
jgi:histidinol phosphatase-like PHP family hydrolase